jgi:hypothetical protein
MVHKPEDHIEFIIESLTRVSFIIEYKQKKDIFIIILIYSIKMKINN